MEGVQEGGRGGCRREVQEGGRGVCRRGQGRGESSEIIYRCCMGSQQCSEDVLPTIIFLGVLGSAKVFFHRELWSRVTDFHRWRLPCNVCCMVQSRDAILPAAQEVL